MPSSLRLGSCAEEKTRQQHSFTTPVEATASAGRVRAAQDTADGSRMLKRQVSTLMGLLGQQCGQKADQGILQRLGANGFEHRGTSPRSLDHGLFHAGRCLLEAPMIELKSGSRCGLKEEHDRHSGMA